MPICPRSISRGGLIDEVRISNTARSAGWVATEYANQNSPSTFSTLGTEVGSPCSAGTPTPTPTPTPPFAWYDCGWAYRKNITIDHTKVAATQSDFPVLISLTGDTDLSAGALANGNDILFTSSDGTTKLSHEIESYSGGTLVAWVKVPSLSSTTNTSLFMYYGNPSSGVQQNAADVWSNSYLGVWHLGEAVTDESSAGVHHDSTSSGFDGTQHNNGPTAGKIDGAQYFDGTADYITMNSHPIPTSQLTMETWVNIPAVIANGKVVSDFNRAGVGNPFYGFQMGLFSAGSSEVMYSEINDVTGLAGGHFEIKQGSFPLNSWTYLANTWTTGGNFIGYINGSQTASIAAGGNNIGDYTGPMRLGQAAWDSSAGLLVTGGMDEVRISSVARSPQWIATGYNSTFSPSTFYVVGSQVSSPCSVTPTPTPAPWYDCNWGERKRITVDHTKVNGTQTSFPVLVKLGSDSGLQAHAQADGDDILFTSPDGVTKIPHEIETYTSGTGALTAWVKVPTVSSATDSFFYMYYGNPAATSQQDPTNVWTGYEGVWHLKESSGAGAYIKDSTANAHDGTPTLTNYYAAGQIGGARQFTESTNEYITAASSTGIFNGNSKFMFSFWIYPDYSSDADWLANSDERVFYKASSTSIPRLFRSGSEPGGTGQFQGDIYFVTAGVKYAHVIINRRQWDYIAIAYDNTNGILYRYVNGIQVSADNIGNDRLVNDATTFALGDLGGNGDFRGYLDEFHVLHSAKSGSWVQTEYNNQNSPSTFSSVAGEEASPCTPPTTVPTTAGPTPTPNPPWYTGCGWPYRKNITIDKAKVVGSQSNFPVLINIATDNDLKNHARADGYDILFTTSDGQTAIPFERESYDSTPVPWSPG